MRSTSWRHLSVLHRFFNPSCSKRIFPLIFWPWRICFYLSLFLLMSDWFTVSLIQPFVLSFPLWHKAWRWGHLFCEMACVAQCAESTCCHCPTCNRLSVPIVGLCSSCVFGRRFEWGGNVAPRARFQPRVGFGRPCRAVDMLLPMMCDTHSRRQGEASDVAVPWPRFQFHHASSFRGYTYAMASLFFIYLDTSISARGDFLELLFLPALGIVSSWVRGVSEISYPPAHNYLSLIFSWCQIYCVWAENKADLIAHLNWAQWVDQYSCAMVYTWTWLLPTALVASTLSSSVDMCFIAMLTNGIVLMETSVCLHELTSVAFPTWTSGSCYTMTCGTRYWVTSVIYIGCLCVTLLGKTCGTTLICHLSLAQECSRICSEYS